MPTVLVCGSRHWSDLAPIRRELAKLPPNTLIIHGAAKGADSLAELAAKQLRLPSKAFPADWTNFGKAAGPIRNQRMLSEGNPDLVLAFHDNIQSSKGTKHMVDIATKHNVPVLLFVA